MEQGDMKAASHSDHRREQSHAQPEAQRAAPTQHTTTASHDLRFIDHYLDDEEAALGHVRGRFQSIVSRVEELFGL